MWRLLMRVEKPLMVLSLVREPTRRIIQNLKDYPVFKVFLFDFRTLAVSWYTRYARAQRAALCDSRTACGVETSKARVPRYEPQKALVPWYQRTSTPTNKYAVSLKSKNVLRRARMSTVIWINLQTKVRSGSFSAGLHPWDISRLCTLLARDAPNLHVMSSFRLMRIFFQSNLFHYLCWVWGACRYIFQSNLFHYLCWVWGACRLLVG